MSNVVHRHFFSCARRSEEKSACAAAAAAAAAAFHTRFCAQRHHNDDDAAPRLLLPAADWKRTSRCCVFAPHLEGPARNVAARASQRGGVQAGPDDIPGRHRAR